MRARILKPDFFRDEELAELPFVTRLLFAGLWCAADREGRLDDRPRRISADIFPYDPMGDAQMDALLQVLHDKGFIIRYLADGNAYIQVKNFSKHQRIHMREAKSIISPPSKAQPRQVLGTTLAMPSTNLGSAEASPLTGEASPRCPASTSTSTSVPPTPTGGECAQTETEHADPDEFERVTMAIWEAHPKSRRGTLQQCQQYASQSLAGAVDPNRLLASAERNHTAWCKLYAAENWAHALKTWWVEDHWRTDPTPEAEKPRAPRREPEDPDWMKSIDMSNLGSSPAKAEQDGKIKAEMARLKRVRLAGKPQIVGGNGRAA